MVENLLNDIRHAARSLLAKPAIPALAALILVIGIGGTVSIFSVSSSVLIRALPYTNPDRLVMVYQRPPGGGTNMAAEPDFLACKTHNDVFDGIAALDYRTYNLTGICTGAG